MKIPQFSIINYKLSIPRQPVVTAVILNYRSCRDTVKCAEALLKQTIADTLEILVTDNHSDDESMGFIRAHLHKKKGVRIIEHKKNNGYGRGNNDAARYAQGEYLLIVNPDNTLPTNALETMLQYLLDHPDTGIVGPALLHPDGTVRPSARSFPTIIDLFCKRLAPKKWHEAFEKKRITQEKDKAIDVDWMVGACLLMKTDFYKSLGGFDERYFLFFEDIDLCRRVKEVGKKVIYLPHVRVLDRKGRLSGSSIFSLLTHKTTRIHMASGIKYFLKWGTRTA